MPIVKVTGTNFVRDTSSMVIMSTDNSERNEYYNKQRMVKNQKDEINKVKQEIEGIKEDMSEIKSLLQQLLGKGQ
jgi:hypothetical protein